MTNLINDFLDKKNIYAVIGVSKNPEKYGNIIYHDLQKAGYKVYPVNPTLTEIDGQKCYQALADLPIKPDVVDVVVPPEVALKIVQECKDLGLNKVWLQPGSESARVLEFCKENNFEILSGVCVMAERRKNWSINNTL